MKHLIIICMLFCSCMTEKKFAQKCADKYPVRGSTIIIPGETQYDTAYLPPDTLVFTDTVTVDCDTVKGIVTKYIYKEKPCPAAQVLTQYRVDTVQITKVDRAAETLARMEAQEHQARADRVTGGRDTWRWIAIVCMLTIAAAAFSKIKGFI